MLNEKKQKAFSLVELMMLLLVASLIVAALVPVVTKKHFRLPSTVIHGAYMCYYKNGSLHETKWSGKSQQKVVFDRDTDQCVFVPPKKAPFFQISAIGGGGGGGDAGYTGGNPIEGWSADMILSPFELTEEMLEKWNIIKCKEGVCDTSEFLANAGKLWGYAVSAASLKGRTAGFSVRNQTGTHCTNWSTKTETTDECKVWGYDKTETKRVYECKKVIENADPETCMEEKTETIEYDVCDDWETYNCNSYTLPQECLEYVPETCKVERVWVPATTRKETKDVTKQGCKQVCKGNPTTCGSSYCGMPDQQAGCKSLGKCEYTVSEQVDVDVPGHYEDQNNCTPAHCNRWSDPVTAWKKCSRCTSSHTESYERTYTVNNCKPTEKTECAYVNKQVVVPYCKEYYTKTTNDECLASVPIYSWSSDYQYGTSGASGASCASTAVPGNLGLKGQGSSTAYTPKESNDKNTPNSCGTNFCSKTDCADEGNAPCVVNGVPHEKSVCAAGEISGSEYSITKDGVAVSTTKATSASSGGAGGCRTCTLNSEGKCVDKANGTTGLVAKAGTCTAGHEASSSELCGSNYYGYCLQHANGGGIEENGSYVHRYSYDNNYLNYGEPGSPGVFKTIIVRSLSDADTTIKVGRGGSAATLNLGQTGSNGSPTSMGNLIFAAGGDGGRGGISKAGQVLPKYDHAVYEKEHDCYFYDKYMNEKNADGSWKYPADRNRLLSKPAGYCSGYNTSSAYQFHIIAGNTFGEYPTPIGFASSIMNFVFNTSDNSEAIQKFIKYGRGGAGGGTEHRCWAGRWEVEFENAIMDKTSVFPSYEAASESARAEHRYVPANCRNDWDNIAAGPGSDGALLIKW